VMLAVVPALIVGIQSYGGEVLFRAYLFSLPWLAFLGASWLINQGSARARRRSIRLALVCVVLASTTLIAYYGLDLGNRIDHGDVQAALWYEKNAPAGSALVLLTPNFPARLTARYDEVNARWGPAPDALTEKSSLDDKLLGSASIPAIVQFMQDTYAKHSYLVLSPSEQRYGQLYGLLPAGTLASLDSALKASTDFQQVYSRDGAVIYSYTGSPAAS
jgi:hypothetical protein